MKSNLFWILIFLIRNQLTYSMKYSLKIINQNPKALEMVDCILQVIFLLGDRKIGFEYSKEFKDLASEIIKKTKIPVVLNSEETRKATGIEYRTSIDLMIILNETTAERILGHSLWNGNTRFLIVSEDVEKIKTYFKNFWKFKAINVFALVPKKNRFFFYSFLPYGKKNCEIQEPLIVDECLRGKLYKKGFAFKDQTRIKNMNGCPINITVNDATPNLILGEGIRKSSIIKGFEGNFMQQLSKMLNFTPTYKLSDDGLSWGWIRPSPHGTVGEVYKGISDMAGGMLGALLDRYETLDLSVNYNMGECLTFGVPKGLGTKTSWIGIFVFEFTSLTWALIAFSFVLITITFWIINKYSNEYWFKSETDLISSAFASFLGFPIKIPLYTSGKISLTYWIICSFIITVAYKASMGSKLAVPPGETDIYTFKELLTLNIELTGYPTMYQLMFYNDWTYNTMRKRYHFTNFTVQDAVKRMAKGEKIAHLKHTTTFYYYSLITPGAKGRIHVLTDCVILFFPLVVLKKYSPFTNKVNQVITRLEETGIIEMWRSKYVYKVPKSQKPFHELSNEQMLGVYCLLLLGYAIAILYFIYELFSYLSTHRKKSFFCK